MFARRTLRHVTAWLAALAVLMTALLPALSHAVMSRLAATNGGLVEVCTVSGMAWVSPGVAPAGNAGSGANAAAGQVAVPADASQLAGNSNSPVGMGMLMASCDWCATHAPGLSLPPVAALSLPLPAQLAEVPPAFLHAPRLLAVWAPAHSRAPPSAA